jgi:hypothetical protein
MIRRMLLGLSLEEASFEKRGFAPTEPARQSWLEDIGRTFLHGYLTALELTSTANLTERLELVDRESRGFAYEGAAMSLLLQDRLWLGSGTRWRTFLDGPGSSHIYMLHVGAGWAVARLPWLRRNVNRVIDDLEPAVRWLVVDGYGFHEGYFHHREAIDQAALPRRLYGYARRAFDQGLGRSIWFVKGADRDRVTNCVNGFPVERRGDLWSGVGLACAYAGGASQPEVMRLYEDAGGHQAAFAQGVSFAAKCRARAGNSAAHTELVCRTVCGMPATEAAAMTDEALAETSRENPPADEFYERWRSITQVAACAHT